MKKHKALRRFIDNHAHEYPDLRIVYLTHDNPRVRFTPLVGGLPTALVRAKAEEAAAAAAGAASAAANPDTDVIDATKATPEELLAMLENPPAQLPDAKTESLVRLTVDEIHALLQRNGMRHEPTPPIKWANPVGQPAAAAAPTRDEL